MKKILISILIILLLVLVCFSMIKGIGFLRIKSINDIKSSSAKLDNDFNEARELSNKTYPSEVEELEDAIKKLKISKQDYENKKINNKEESSLGSVEIKTYKIHYLWTILGNYRKDRRIQSLNLDLKTTQAEDVYDLQFTLLGSYTNITDFLYDIENDEELNFEIKDFVISSDIITNDQVEDTNSNNNILSNANENENENTNENQEDNSQSTKTNNTTKTTKSDGVTLQARFTVENIGITLD